MSRTSNTTRIREALETAIVNGTLAPGARIDPEALARDFGCSRTPIREALQQLQASGLVRVHSKQGTFVSEWNAEELAERFEAMAEIEGICARLAARRISEPELEALEARHQACLSLAGASAFDDYYSENTAFHVCIYEATHNAFLAAEARRLHAMLQPYRRMQLRARGRLTRSHAEHAEVMAAIRAGDGAAAEAAMRGHVLIQGDRFHDLVATLRSGAGRAAAG
ncbi:GntR family transcriptional regulator [Roseicyclus sp. F158]|uniref:GntR family transcriptional regulator n=1 Tax=Tropicimonas omnivorans TaxID=3075590 RepID=A0ABU3DJ26_9RHOB|nr:GntR family transcriptional regulator [Roseicyclus sp. F158]MDT0683112.1 GntR family transcriptional regulator [Roseicyclus sp. F158]